MGNENRLGTSVPRKDKDNMKLHDIQLNDGFWRDLYTRNAEISIYAVQKQFEATGRFEALRFTHAEKPDTPLHFFFDSDVAKWMEAVAYLLMNDRARYANLEDFCDGLIAHIVKNQRPDGYFNSYFQQVEPEKIFTDRDWHELYCMGHYMEAAVAYDEATGKHDLLHSVKRMADCIRRVFIEEQSAPFATGGHEEIELALLRLYDYTGDEAYLDMARHFLYARGDNDLDRGKHCYWGNPYYHQDNAPAIELDEADGHAVRACYFYTAMAHYAADVKDARMLEACRKLYDNIVTKKMYVTGGVGSTRSGEAFATNYSLPNSTAYSESCAAIALMFFCRNMRKNERDAKYADTIERVLYNGFLSSTSIDGKRFFYENPLEINLAERDIETCIRPQDRQRFPITQRLEVFACSCCPPNINRVMASLGDYIYTEEADGIYVEQYMASQLDKYGLTVMTDFPHSGDITLRGRGYPFKKVAIRVPSWCEDAAFDAPAALENGYAVFMVGSDFDIKVSYPLKPKFAWANTKIFSDIGRTALTYGPIVYCLEGCDNGGTLTDLFVDTDSPITLQRSAFQPLPELVCDGVRVAAEDALYTAAKPNKLPRRLIYIPYHAFANRGEQNMQVWVSEMRL